MSDSHYSTGICERCGAEFAKTMPNKRFCSEACRKAAERKRLGSYWREHKPDTLRTCQWCGAEFMARAYEVRRGRGVVCSMRCAAQRGEYLKRGCKAYSEPVVYQDCKTCGAVFVKHHGSACYCSDECVPYVYQCVDDERECRACGVTFHSPYTGGARATCCSPECESEWPKMVHRERMATDPEYAARYRAGRKARKFDLTAAEMRTFDAKVAACHGRCPDCGRRVTKRNPWSIDHYQPRSKGGADDVRNYRPLCRDCNCKTKRDLVPNVDYFAERAATGQLAIVAMV